MQVPTPRRSLSDAAIRARRLHTIRATVPIEEQLRPPPLKIGELAGRAAASCPDAPSC
jgi:hypothetical protein